MGNGHKFQITVNARFKPIGKSRPMAPSRPVVLPLHQRMALIRMNRKSSSQKEACKALFQQGEWFGESQRAERDSASSVEEDENTSKTCNAKPRLSCGVHSIDSNHDYVIMVDKTKGLRKFKFDRVFDDEGSQKQVYNATAMPLLADFINGCNATCLAFGQTGSGKSKCISFVAFTSIYILLFAHSNLLSRKDLFNVWVRERFCRLRDVDSGYMGNHSKNMP